MKRHGRLLIGVIAGTAALIAAMPSIASAAPTTATKAIAGVPCSVTATLQVSGSRMSYGGGVSCRGGVGQKTIDVVPQVGKLSGGTQHWYSISLAGRYQGPTSASPVRLSDQLPAVSGHVYRLLVVARVQLPNGSSGTATACVGCTGSATLSLRGSHPILSEPSSTVKLSGSKCAVTQNGLVFTLVNGSYVLTYGGFVSCPAGSTTRTAVKVCVQVGGSSRGHTTWFTVAGSCAATGSSTHNLLALVTARTAYFGHAYRIRVTATVTYKSGSGTRTESATATSRAATP